MSLIGAAFGASVKASRKSSHLLRCAALLAASLRYAKDFSVDSRPIVEHELVRELFHLPQREVRTAPTARHHLIPFLNMTKTASRLSWFYSWPPSNLSDINFEISTCDGTPRSVLKRWCEDQRAARPARVSPMACMETRFPSISHPTGPATTCKIAFGSSVSSGSHVRGTRSNNNSLSRDGSFAFCFSCWMNKKRSTSP